MTVAELREILKDLPGDALIVCYDEGEFYTAEEVSAELQPAGDNQILNYPKAVPILVVHSGEWA